MKKWIEKLFTINWSLIGTNPILNGLKGKVTFDHPTWTCVRFDSDIFEDFYMLAKSIHTLTKGEKEMLDNSNGLDFKDLRALLKKHGYSEAEDISTK